MSTIGTVDDELAAALSAAENAARVDDALRVRIDESFAALHDAVGRMPGATSAELSALVTAAVVSSHARSLDLRVHGEQRAARPDRMTSRFALGAACYADRFAGNLAGLRDEIPYLRELGVSLLHVQSPFARRGDGTVDLRRGDPGLGSIDRLTELAAALRLAGISLAVDVAASGSILSFADDLLFLANRGVEAFIIADRAVGAVIAPVLAIGAPGVAVLAASPGSAPLWQALATGDAAPLRRAVGRRGGRADVAAVRDADAVVWHEDTDRLTAAYADGLGLPVPGGIAGTAASLAGVGQGSHLGEARLALAHAVALSVPGLPVLWLGDEVGALNDETFRDDPDRRDDPRWVHRGQKPRDRYATRTDAATAAGRIFRDTTKLIAVRHTTPEFDGTTLVGFDVPAPSVAAWQRPGADAVVLVLVNAASHPVTIDPVTFSGFAPEASDLVEGVDVDLGGGLTLPACGFRWLRVSPAA
ncbi:hypothetical protein KZX37_05320 [Microbacterium sp. EYE_5]|uniref:hypothetical protein n=1 Tax=unclassified Microbacterium TaxID=2609290 RepID=UPI00200379FC|nr:MULTISPECIES: hypothetical protein [unclassified Microbacterium]MCK6080040.1 hypothetical protein [Microbacterium sp. EYE_382]MCK6085311.1 hypothetical protein [Microbacterium sp. EYE_384]MCK6122464.1 hypothetical protein [Microbacterium sp. EYE_80]MCK6126074.1 hypothetical protein [Microbacterium sp. EYE_79]MCK6140995.1 hypothetical protein [Microbacterium sp. EYE_39]